MVLPTEKSLINSWLFFISFQLNNGLKSVVNVVTTSIACKVFLTGNLPPTTVFSPFSTPSGRR
jgi:hypothetical protein